MDVLSLVARLAPYCWVVYRKAKTLAGAEYGRVYGKTMLGRLKVAERGWNRITVRPADLIEVFETWEAADDYLWINYQAPAQVQQVREWRKAQPC